MGFPAIVKSEYFSQTDRYSDSNASVSIRMQYIWLHLLKSELTYLLTYVFISPSRPHITCIIDSYVRAWFKCTCIILIHMHVHILIQMHVQHAPRWTGFLHDRPSREFQHNFETNVYVRWSIDRPSHVRADHVHTCVRVVDWPRNHVTTWKSNGRRI